MAKNASTPQPVPEAGNQTMVDAESVDEFVHTQTTHKKDEDQADINELNEDDKNILRFISNTDKNRFTNISCFDEILDSKDPEFYVHANTYHSPHGNFIISQAPKKNTIGDHLHLIWQYNVRVSVCLEDLLKIGEYFDKREGGKVTVFMKYTMKTLKVYDVKQGVTVYQCELKSYKAQEPMNRRTIYIICAEVPISGIRSARVQSVIMEYMWAFEQAEELENGSGSESMVLVHGLAGTRRCAAFITAAVMCRQILQTGQFNAMETWIEMRKRRAHTCTRRHDFYSSIYTVFAFAVQCCLVSETDPNFGKSMELIRALLEKKQPHADDEPSEVQEPTGTTEV